MARVAERKAALAQWCRDTLPAGEPIVLEFGCGHGHFLTAYAQAFPELTCVGIDIIHRRIEKANEKARKRSLDHLHFIKAEADEFVEALRGHTTVAAFFMLFPDPWPKKRHFKHRMVQTEFLAEIASLAAPGTRFHFRSDHTGYHRWTSSLLYAHPQWEILPDAPWPFEQETVFQSHMESYHSVIAQVVASGQ